MTVFLLALSVAGCGKKKSARPAAAAQPASETSPQPGNPVNTGGQTYHPPVAQALPRAATQTIAANAGTDAAAAQLTTELRRYVGYTRTIPKNFDDFIAHDPVKFPPAPAGKKYVIEQGQVVVH